MTDSAARQAEIIEEFNLFEDWQERYAHIIELGRALPPYPPEFQTDDYLVRGCQSRVWLHPRSEKGMLYFDAASDALIVSGLVALVLRVYSGLSPAAILATEPHFIADVGLQAHLSPNRGNGLLAMIGTIKTLAREHLTTGL